MGIPFNKKPTNVIGYPLIRNGTVFGGHVIYSDGGTLTLTNSIVWNNDPDGIHIADGTASVAYCDVQGGWLGKGNIEREPLFVALNNGDYHLKSQGGRWEPAAEAWIIDEVTSPCIDAGDPMSPLGSEPFPNAGIINMGAYGGTAEASKSYFGEPPCEIVVTGDINGDCNVNFLDFRIMALHWLEEH